MPIGTFAATFEDWSRKRAKQLHDLGFIYALFGALDGLSLSYSTLKYLFDIFLINTSVSSSDTMHEWMVTPAGIAITATESISIILFSMFANHFSNQSVECGLMRSDTDPALWDEATRKELTKGKNSIVLFNDGLYRVNADKNTLQKITPTEANQADIDKLTTEMPKSFRMAEVDELKLITNIIGSPNFFKRFIVVLWPYIRDAMKALKNSLKGLRSTLQMLNHLGGFNLNMLLLPVGLMLGGLSVANRFWYRHMKNERKEMMDLNKGIQNKIKSMDSLSDAEYEYYIGSVRRQTGSTKRGGLLSASCGGVVDSMYLYIGILSICGMSSPLFAAMASLCIAFSFSYIATRIYEEYDFQRKLEITAAKTELALYKKKYQGSMQAIVAELNTIMEQLAKAEELKLSAEAIEKLQQQQNEKALQLGEQLNGLNAKRQSLQNLMTLSHLSAFLAGIKNGLAAYSALSSATFAIGTILVLTSTPFPPLLLMSMLLISTSMMIVFVLHSVIENIFERQRQLENSGTVNEQLNDILQTIKSIGEDESSEDKLDLDVEKIMGEGLITDPSPQFHFQEWFEVIRSFFAGLSKGSKSVDYTFNPLQEADAGGHYHDTPIMGLLTLAGSAFYSIALTAQSFARNFARAEPGVAQNLPDSPPSPSDNSRTNQPKSPWFKYSFFKPANDAMSNMTPLPANAL